MTKKMLFPLEKKFSIKYIYCGDACELINKVLPVLTREEVILDGRKRQG
jgi:hypothetical protein